MRPHDPPAGDRQVGPGPAADAPRVVLELAPEGRWVAETYPVDDIEAARRRAAFGSRSPSTAVPGSSGCCCGWVRPVVSSTDRTSCAAAGALRCGPGAGPLPTGLTAEDHGSTATLAAAVDDEHGGAPPPRNDRPPTASPPTPGGRLRARRGRGHWRAPAPSQALGHPQRHRVGPRAGRRPASSPWSSRPGCSRPSTSRRARWSPRCTSATGCWSTRSATTSATSSGATSSCSSGPDSWGTGDIDDLIKRVIGLPGETVAVRDGEVYIDGERLDEPWLPDDVITPAFFAESGCVPDVHARRRRGVRARRQPRQQRRQQPLRPAAVRHHRRPRLHPRLAPRRLRRNLGFVAEILRRHRAHQNEDRGGFHLQNDVPAAAARRGDELLQRVRGCAGASRRGRHRRALALAIRRRERRAAEPPSRPSSPARCRRNVSRTNGEPRGESRRTRYQCTPGRRRTRASAARVIVEDGWASVSWPRAAAESGNTR